MPTKKSSITKRPRKTTSVPSVVARKVSKSKTTAKKSTKAAVSQLTAEVFNISGKKEGAISLPKEIFGAKVNKKLLAQAIHIYRVNDSAHHGSTKTRGNVRGGGAKPWRQKGTGRARAGSRRSPLWVGGGKALGPSPRKVELTIPKKMKRQALISALSAKAQDGSIKVITNLEKIEPKTKIVANLIQKTNLSGTTLFVISKNSQTGAKNIILATRNIQEISLDTTQNLNTYEVIKNRNILFSKEALSALPDRITRKAKEA